MRPAERRRADTTRAFRVLAALLVVWGAIAVVRPTHARQIQPTVILVSFDGWRWDYEQKVPLQNLRRLAARGVKADALIPSFPTKTFPNHYTVVTGLYPGRHGMVANNILDAATGRTFTQAKREEVGDAMWWGGEPVWVGAERAGQHTATLFWPGSEAPIGGVRPSHFRLYDGDMAPSDRIRWVLERLDLPPGERPTLLTLYFEDVDDAGHAQGPDSQAVRDATIRADSYLGQLVAGLEARGLDDEVNIVVLSDHGMSAVSQDRVIVADDYVSADDVAFMDATPWLAVYPKPGREEAVYRALRRAHPRLSVYRRAETPRHWHYRDHPRIAPIVGVADEGWQVMRRRTLDNIRAGTATAARGEHGYDTRVRAMRGIFYAAGPAFRQGVRVAPFENVSVYRILARVLGVPPAANDGDPAVARAVLR